MKTFSSYLVDALCALAIGLSVWGCGGDGTAGTAADGVNSYLQGRLTVSSEIDSIADYRDFEVLVYARDQGDVDTLGFATTDSTGFFGMDVHAPDRGVFPLVISRRGTTLGTGSLVVAEGDSASLEEQLPLGNRLLRVRSRENAGWFAYLNTKATHNQEILRMLRTGTADPENIERSVRQASAILWNLRDSYGGTVGAQLGAAEAIVMLGGWDDSLLVARAEAIPPENPNYVDVARAARQAEARLAGQDRAIALVHAFQERALDDEQRAALQSEVVLAHVDSLEQDSALAAVATLKQRFPDTQWAQWADRAVYEIENLMPGMPAPPFTLKTLDGDEVSLDYLRGSVVLLEFYDPKDEDYQASVPFRSEIYEATKARPFNMIAVSVEPDSAVVEAFVQNRLFPGFQAIATQGLQSSIARKYNVNVVPTRVLIDREGRIVKKFSSRSLVPVQEALARIFSQGTDEPAS